MCWMANRRKGRSLRELGGSLLSVLLTLVVVAILFVFLHGASQGVAHKSRQAHCLNNLRQIGIALHLYLADHQGMIPPNRSNKSYWTEETPAGVHWQDALKHYLSPYPDYGTITPEMAGVFWCPADLDRRQRLAQHSYGCNTFIGGGGSLIRYQSEPRPSHRIYLLEATVSTRSTSMFSHKTWPFNAGSKVAPDTDVRIDFRHEGRANGLFLDGHVATFSMEYLYGKDPRLAIPPL